MSGTNSLTQSVIEKEGGSESALTKALMNANEVAKKQDKKKKAK